MQDYRWDSPASLYTFQETIPPFLAWLGITSYGFPEFTQFSSISLLKRGPEEF